MVDLTTLPVYSRIRETANGDHDQIPKATSGNGSLSAFRDGNERAFASNDSFVWNGFQNAQPKSRPLSEPLPILGLDLDARVRTESIVEASATKDFAHRPPRETAIYTREVAHDDPSRAHENLVHESFLKRSDSGSDLNPLIVTPDRSKPNDKLKPNKKFTFKRSHTFGVQASAPNIRRPSTLLRPLAETRLFSNDISTAQITRKLKKATVRSRHYHIKFLPTSQLANIVTDDAVRNELIKRKHSISNLWKRPKAMMLPEQNGSYRKIFAVLCLMKRLSKLRFFVECGVCDTHLPLDKVSLSDSSGKHFGLRSRLDTAAPMVELRREDDIDEFVERQWSVLAPYFAGSDGTHISHSDLQPETILPFLNCTDTVKVGGSGRVFKAEIHPDHHSLSKPEALANQKACNVYAIKVLSSKDVKAFEQEVTILRKLSSERHSHPHLITLLATYRHDDLYHLVFPWADTDLFGYWQRFPDPPELGDKIGTWLVEQCRGLAAGLNTIHRYATFSGTSLLKFFGSGERQAKKEDQEPPRTESANLTQAVKNLFGRHGDLKPENIIWFPDTQTRGGHGILKITDFGIARFSTENMWDTWKTGRVPNSPSYRSPECDLDGKLTTACDVWALGCVYLQFITWYFGGYKHVERFGKRRLEHDDRYKMKTDTFFTIYEQSGVKRAKVKDSVIEELKEHQRCTTDFRKFLDMIQSHMLVVHHEDSPADKEIGNLTLQQSVSESLSVPGSPRRLSCGDIFRTLGSIKPRSDQEGNPSRRSTLEPTSPIAQNFWFLPERLAEPKASMSTAG
ncbi:Nn.00g099840.m01.CDS01 [Neocucurbitaria sp. VM-36]